MSENVLNRIINKRTDKKVVGVKKMSVLNKIISKRTTLSYGTDFLNREKRDRSSGAMRGYMSLSTEGKRDVNKILMDDKTGVVGVHLQPDSARTVKQDHNEFTRKNDKGMGVVYTVLGSVPNVSMYPELQGKEWLSKKSIAGKDFLGNIIINTLGIKFGMSYDDMVKFADDSTNPITDPLNVPRTPETDIEQRLKDVDDIYTKQIEKTKEKDVEKAKEDVNYEELKRKYEKRMDDLSRERAKEVGR